jgi:hypothetical protein
MLCGTVASGSVDYHGRRVAVCQIHVATYERWAGEAEANAETQWEWFYGEEPPLGI